MNAPIGNYRRELNLNHAMADMEFTRGGVTFTRERSSAPNQVMVLRLSAEPRQKPFLFLTRGWTAEN